MQGLRELAVSMTGADNAGPRRTAVALAVSLLLLSTLDLSITDLVIEEFGGRELNPLMQQLLLAPWAAVISKVGLPIVCIGIALVSQSWRVVRLLRIAVALYMGVVIFTLSQVATVIA